MDGLRASPSPNRFAIRELWSLLRNGAGERMDQLRVQSPDTSGASYLISTFRDDFRLALRKLSKSVGFSTAVVLTLAVGIGATVAMFSILEVALLRSLPYPEPHELVLGRATFSGETNMTASFPDYLSHKEETEAFEVMAAVIPYTQMATLTDQGTPVRVSTWWVTTNFFEALEVAPVMGRAFVPEEGEANSPDVIVVSHGLWQDWFGGDPQVVGEILNVGERQATVIGVMPAGFRFMGDADMWAPVRMGMFDTEGRDSHSWVAIGRLKDEVTVEQAQTQLNVVSAQLSEAYPESHANKGFRIVPLGEGLAENYRPGILLLMGATTLLLLIACGNVAGLLAARATSRRVEISVRAALGASRGTLVRQLLVESLMIALMAGVGGSMLALWIQRAVLSAVPLDRLGVTEVGLSGPMLLFALLASLGTAILFGTGPALQASRTEPAKELKGGRTSTGGKSGSRFRGGLVIAQVALSVILLTASGLLIRSFVQLQAVDLGFPTRRILTASVAIDPARYQDLASRTRFYQGVIEDVEAMPSVASASFVDKIPILQRWTNWYIWDADAPPESENDRVSTYLRVSMPGYFQTLEVPILRGRDHLIEDMGRDEAYLVINQATADAVFPEQDPIGKRIGIFNGMGETYREVVGVVGNFRITSVDREPRPQMYFNHAEAPNPGMKLIVNVEGEPSALVPAIRLAIMERDPGVPLQDVATMEEVVSGSLSTTRLLSMAIGLFAVTALLLALTGLYAVLAFYVGQRTREIGIRVAFGATGGVVSRMVLMRGLGMVGGGLVLGLLGAAASTRVLQSQLYEVGTVDPWTFGSVAGGFVVVGVLAALLPAHRATTVDPVRAMQVE